MAFAVNPLVDDGNFANPRDNRDTCSGNVRFLNDHIPSDLIPLDLLGDEFAAFQLAALRLGLGFPLLDKLFRHLRTKDRVPLVIADQFVGSLNNLIILGFADMILAYPARVLAVNPVRCGVTPLQLRVFGLHLIAGLVSKDEAIPRVGAV